MILACCTATNTGLACEPPLVLSSCLRTSVPALDQARLVARTSRDMGAQWCTRKAGEVYNGVPAASSVRHRICIGCGGQNRVALQAAAVAPIHPHHKQVGGACRLEAGYLNQRNNITSKFHLFSCFHTIQLRHTSSLTKQHHRNHDIPIPNPQHQNTHPHHLGHPWPRALAGRRSSPPTITTT